MLAVKKQCQCLRGRHSPLATSRQVTANPTEDICSLHGSEATGDLLLHLGHTQIVLALVVGEGDALHLHEAQHIVLEVS